jgi:hypothetical protein
MIQTNKNKTQFIHTAVALPPFHHLVLNDVRDVDVRVSTTDSVIVFHNPSTIAIMPNYHIKGDTLMVTWPYKEKEMQWSKTITCAKLRSITLKNSKIDFHGLNADSLSILAHSGDITMNYGGVVKYFSINLQADSKLWCNMGPISSVKLDMSHSAATFRADIIGHLQAELRNASEINVQKVLRTEVTSDESSRYYSR